MNLNLSYKNGLLLFAFGFFFGLFLSYLWAQSLIPEYSKTITTISPKSLEEKVVKSENAFVTKIDSLNTRNEKLNYQLKNTITALESSKKKTAFLQTQVFDLVHKRLETGQTQTEKKDSLCDSLADTYPSLIDAFIQKDSLLESVTTNLESQLTLKDSMITTQHNEYAELKSAFNTSIMNQKSLVSENNILKKRVRWQKVESKIITATLFLISGAVASYLLHH